MEEKSYELGRRNFTPYIMKSEVKRKYGVHNVS
jgi:hypothetical protein